MITVGITNYTMVENSVIKEGADTIERLRGIIQVCAWSIAAVREKMHDSPASADLHLAEALTAIGECGFRIDGKSLPWVADFRKAFAADVVFYDDDEVVEILNGGLPANMKRVPNEHDAS